MKHNTLEQQAKEEENKRKKTERRKRRENQLRKQVARKSVANDMKHVMEKQNKEALQRYRYVILQCFHSLHIYRVSQKRFPTFENS